MRFPRCFSYSTMNAKINGNGMYKTIKTSPSRLYDDLEFLTKISLGGETMVVVVVFVCSLGGCSRSERP